MSIIPFKKNTDPDIEEEQELEEPTQTWSAEEAARFRQAKTPEEKRRSRNYVLRTIISLLAVVVLFVAAILVWYYRDRFDPDGLVLSTQTAAVAKEEYALDTGTGQLFASAGTGLAAATNTGFVLMKDTGQVAVSRVFQMKKPAIAACGDYAVFYDIGSTSMAVARFDGYVQEFTPAGNVFSASVSDTGYLTVTTDCTGYRGLVTVYDPSLKPIYEWYSSSAWVISAEVSPDGKALVVLSYTASGSEVRFFDLSKSDQQAAFSVSDTVLLDVRWLSTTQLCGYSVEQAIFFNNKGQWSNTYSFGSQFLTGCTFDGDGYVTFSLSPYRTGTASVLVSLDSGGRQIGTAQVQSEIISLTAHGTEVLILCPDGAVLYSSALSEKGRLTGLLGFKYAFLRNRGEALFISSNYAEVYTF